MPPTILFSGGGTGGHLFPALAIADAIRAQHPDAILLFICSNRPIDTSILTDAGVDFIPSQTRPFSLRPKQLVRFAANFGPAVRQSRTLIRGDAARPRASALIAMGGFVAPPSVQAAHTERTPTILVNLDAVPGKANRWCARHVDSILTAAEGDAVPHHWNRIGPIVRPQAKATIPPDQARLSFNLDPNLKTLLITGGSQGARSINQFLAAFIDSKPAELEGWQILHQCGQDEAETLQVLYDAAGIPAKVVEFIDRVGDAWAAADLCIARSGAGTVAEAWANRVPTLFLPYPYHRDEHQKHNAKPLVDAGGGGGARLAKDEIDAEKNLQSVAPILRKLLEHDQERTRMRAALESLGPAEGAQSVAAVVSDLLNPKR